MDFDQISDFMERSPATTEPELDARARAWLASAGIDVEAGDAEPVTLVVVNDHRDCDPSVFALPQSMLGDQGHQDLERIDGHSFEHNFGIDLEPDRFVGALRIFGGICPEDEKDVFEEQIDDVRDDLDASVDIDALYASAGAWEPYTVRPGAKLTGPVTRLYTATICN